MPKCNFPNPATCDQATTDVSPNFALPGLDPLKAHRFDARVDWVASEKQRIFTRFSYDKLEFSTANVFPSPGWDPDYALNTTNGRNALVADDITLNSSTVLNLRYSFTRHYENQGGPPSYLSTDITNLGTVNGAQVGFPASLAAQEVFKQLPFMVFNDVGGGVGGTADYNNFVYASENSDANATITKICGKHEISTGFEWMKRYLNVGQPPAPAGSYLFRRHVLRISPLPVRLAAAITPPHSSAWEQRLATNQAVIRISPKTSSRPNPIPTTQPSSRIPIMPHTKLTITAGLRWDIFGGRNERFNRQEYFDPTCKQHRSGVSYTGAESM